MCYKIHPGYRLLFRSKAATIPIPPIKAPPATSAATSVFPVRRNKTTTTSTQLRHFKYSGALRTLRRIPWQLCKIAAREITAHQELKLNTFVLLEAALLPLQWVCDDARNIAYKHILRAGFGQPSTFDMVFINTWRYTMFISQQCRNLIDLKKRKISLAIL